MADPIDTALDAALIANVAAPKVVQGDMGRVESQPISDLIALAKYRRSIRKGHPLGFIRLTKIVPGDAS